MARAPRRLRSRAVAFVTAILAVSAVVGALAFVRLLPQAAEPAAPAPAGARTMVFAEFGLKQDSVYLAPASAPELRTLIGTVNHAEGWGINPGVEMSGDLFAYTVLPPGSEGRRDAPAELWVFDTGTRNRTRLARDADLLVQPVFVGDGSGVLYRRSDSTQQEIVEVDLARLTRSVAHAETTSFGIFPIGIDADGDLLFARLSQAGTDVLSVHGHESPALLFHASDFIARDWRMSPDGSTLAYLAPEQEGERVVYRAHLAPLRNVSADGLPMPMAATEQYGPTWTPDGRLTIGQESGESAEPAIVLGPAGAVAPLAAAAQGFDVPMAWSPDGRYLAVRWFDGANSARPGSERIVVIDRFGGRTPVTSDGELIYIGWRASA